MLLAVALGVSTAGCNDKFLDPTQIGRFRPTPAVNVILDSLGVAEEAPVAWESAELPGPGDITVESVDYALQPGDVVQVAIFELLQEGATLVNNYVVSETGKISVPDVGIIQAAGLTETQLEQEIKRILSPNILREPSVTVTLLDSQQRTFSILGNAVSRAGRYVIPRYDFRLADALATAGAQVQFNVSYVYVSRRGEAAAAAVQPKELSPRPTQELELIEPPLKNENGAARRPPSQGQIPEPSEPAGTFELQREMLDMIAPQAKSAWPQSRKVIGTPTPGPPSADITASVMPGGFRYLIPSESQKRVAEPQEIVQSPAEFGTINPSSPPSAGPVSEPRTEWIYRGGKWVSIPVPGEETPRPLTKAQPRGPVMPLEEEKLPMEMEWEQAIQTRLLRIPADKLLAGDPRYNVIIKPGDTIHVPVDIIGEFAITGNVNRAGFINITGRQMTLKMAIAAAGGLGPLAWPKHVEVVRRIGTRKEEIVLVDLDKIASGEQPDFFIKPNDLINVGTHPTSRWRAVLRNAFRAAYGFGFVYDRNFADADFGKGFRLPGWL